MIFFLSIFCGYEKIVESLAVDNGLGNRSIHKWGWLHGLCNFLDGAHLPLIQLIYPFHHKLFFLALVEGSLMGYFAELFEGEVGGDELDCELKEASLSDGFNSSFRIYFYYLAEVFQFWVTVEVAKILQ